jgi:hypothetical protein
MRNQRPAFLTALLLSLVLAALVLGACYNKKDYSLTAPHAAAIISLQSVGGATTLPADGVSRLGLMAKISANSDPDKRDILFTTSAGTLIGGTPDAASGGQVVTAAADGEAPIQLQSSTQIQAAEVTAAVKNAAGVVATLAVQFVAVTPNNELAFVVDPASAPADGFTLSTFTVTVSPALVNRTVEFKTTNGTFSPAGSQDVTVPVATDNTATVFLKSPATIGNAQVTATSNGFTRTATIQFVAVVPGNIISFSSTPGSALPADGATLTPFTVTVAPQLISQTVTFKASAGTFVDNPVSVDVNDRATGHLMSPSTIGNADVTATINGFTVDTAVQFTRALPDRITITGAVPQSLPAKDGVSTQVTAQLARNVGSVTPGAVATFTAADANHQSVGFFSESQVATTDTGGTITTNFFPGAAAAPGLVTITVTTPGDGGGTVSSSIVVEIVAM